jgi:phosphopantothenoylcysteine decarboxylase/phosphopantothenate--cysteine ligase
MTTLKSKRIVLGVTGGIAAYKVASVASRLSQDGHEVRVCMTESATRFITPLTFQALTGNPVYTSMWDHIENQDPQHVALARGADVVLVAPASMDFLAKLAAGMADDVVSLILSAVDRTRTPVLLSPSMNSVMWHQPATQRNLATLRGDGYRIIEPAEGWQACRTVGPGRMPEAEELVGEVRRVVG